MGFKHAFDCKRYGKGPCDCPCWVEMLEKNERGDERITKDCQFVLAPRMWVEVIRASNRPAAAVESTRNEIAKGFQSLTRALPRAKE